MTLEPVFPAAAAPVPASAPLPLTLAERLAPAGSALLVVDMQNDFCAPGGYVQAVMGKDVAAAAGIVATLAALLDSARTAGVPVFWLRADYRHDRIPRSMLVKLRARGITQECCAPETWGAAWFGVEPRAGEPVFTKHTYCGFHDTGLHAALQAAGVHTLAFAGVQTHICVESTLRAAHSLGYYCVVAEDAVASHSPNEHLAALANVRFLFGDVCASADLRHAWSRS